MPFLNPKSPFLKCPNHSSDELFPLAREDQQQTSTKSVEYNNEAPFYIDRFGGSSGCRVFRRRRFRQGGIQPRESFVGRRKLHSTGNVTHPINIGERDREGFKRESIVIIIIIIISSWKAYESIA